MKRSMLVLLCLAGAAQAQMFKCVQPGGKVEYRGSACDDARQDTPIRGAISNVPAMPQQDIQRATAAERAPTGPTMTVIGGEQRRGVPTERDVKNLETSASSVTLGQKEKKFLQDELRRAKLAHANGTAYSDNDKRELEHLRSLQTSADLQARERARRQAEQIHMRTGDPDLIEDVSLARRAEQEYDGARRAAANAEAARRAQNAAAAAAAQQAAMQPSNDRLTQCFGGSCQSSSGERYNPVPGLQGQFRRSSDGKGCTAGPGGQISCW